MRKRSLAALAFSLMSLGASLAAQGGRPAMDTILFISSGSSRERVFLMEQAFEDAWKKRDPATVVLDYRLAAFLLPVNDRAYNLAERQIAERLQGRKLGLIVSDGDPSTDLALPLRDAYFPAVPILVIGASDNAISRYGKSPELYQFGLHDFAGELVKLGFSLFPEARRGVIVIRVGAGTEAFQGYLETLRRQFAGREISAVLNPDRLSVEAMLRSSPKGTFVALMAPGWTDAQGRLLLTQELVRSLEDDYGFPVLSFVKEYLGSGLVGGVGVSAQDLGRKAAETGLALLLDGKVPEAWMQVQDIASTFIDYQALLKFGSSPLLIPRGAEVANLPASLWDRYKSLFMAAIAILVAAVAWLLFTLIERRRERLILLRANEALEQKVVARTKELRSANEELSASNDNLTLMMRRTEAMQENVLRHEREVTLGRLTTGIAHELNTPLEAIRSANESLRSVILEADPALVGSLASLDPERRALVLRYAGRVVEGAVRAQPDSAVAAPPPESLEARLKALSCACPISVAADLLDAGLGDLDDGELREFASDGGAAAQTLYRLSVLGRSTSIVDSALGQAVEVLGAIREYLADYRSEGKRVLLRSSIERALLLFKNRLPQGNAIRTDFAFDDAVVGDEIVLVRIWVHLIQNALEAMPGGGTLRVSLAREDGFAIATFDDEGVGIQPSIAGELFSPFVTTKPPAEGMGLGLAYCRKAIEAIGGSISFAARERGTSFAVRLPIEGMA